MYCTKCGAKLPDEAKFCMSCGKPVEAPVTCNANDNADEAPADNRGKQEEICEKDEASQDEPEAAATPSEHAEPTDKTDPKEKPRQSDDAEANEPSAVNADDAADKTTVLANPAKTDPNATTVINRSEVDPDATTLLPGAGTEKAALEQEHSDQVEALASLYPDVDPGQFCDPTPVEAKSPDITEFIAPAPLADGEQPASSESLRYAVDSTKKRSRRRVPLIVIVALAMALAAGTAYAAYRIYNDIWLPAQQTQAEEPQQPAEPEEQSQDLSYTVENVSMDVSVPADPYYEPCVRGTQQWYYPQIKASGKSDAVDAINAAIERSMQTDVDATNASPDTADALSNAGTLTCTDRTISVTYIDSDIVCVRDQRYDTGWGPHGTTEVTGCVYDLHTGETIDPGSVFGLSASDLKQETGNAVASYLLYHASDLYSSNEVVQDIQSNCTDDPSTTSGVNVLDGCSRFYIANEGLIFASADYEMGSYAYGRREIVVVPRDGSNVAAGDTVALTAPFGANGSEQ